MATAKAWAARTHRRHRGTRLRPRHQHPNAVQEEILEASPVIIGQIEKDLADLVGLVGRMKSF